jgi:transposase
VKNMIRNRRLSKSIVDAGWRMFITYLSYKAARQGKRLVEVPAHGTSQTCICGAVVPKTLAIRLHECEECGLVQDRDIVSARVILQRALNIVAGWTEYRREGLPRTGCVPHRTLVEIQSDLSYRKAAIVETRSPPPLQEVGAFTIRTNLFDL